MLESKGYEQLEQENGSLRAEIARLNLALVEIQGRLAEPEDIIRAIRQGEIDALVVQQQGQEEIYAVQKFDSVYRAIVEEAFPYGVWLARLNGQLLYVSPSFLKLVETTLQEMREQGQFHFLPREARQQMESILAASQQTGQPFSIEYTIQLQDASEKTIWTQGMLVSAHDGMPHWVGVNIDVTEREQYRRELHRQAEALRLADRHKDEFLAMLAHELRNPLAPIRSGLELLAMQEREEDSEVIGLMQEQVEHLVRLVDDLLDVSRIMRGRVELRKEPVDLAALIKRSVAAVRPLIERHEQKLSVSVAEEPIWLNADPVRLVQVIGNLLNNASKYTDAGGRIELSAEPREGVAAISVRDTGIGIEPELLPHVFELFTQSSRSLDRAQGGLGIGLTLVQRLVEMHGGTVSADSDGPGRGSTFSVRLPTVEADAPAETRIDERPVHRSRRILVVDDNVGAAWMLANLLLKLGDHSVQAAHNGPSALEMVKETHPEIVLLDIGLSGMDGYQVARAIREMPECDDVLLIALTGYGQEEDRKRSGEAGFDEHLVKPPSVDQIKTILGHPKLPTA